MAEKNYITILGIGSIILGDEGFGVHFIRHIESKYIFPENVKVIDGGTLAYTLLDIICSCEHLIVVDVVKIKDEPGSVYRFTQQELDVVLPPATSAHEVEFKDVLFQAELLGEVPSIAFLCVVPAKYSDMDIEMTDIVKARFPLMEELLLKELKRLGVEPKKV